MEIQPEQKREQAPEAVMPVQEDALEDRSQVGVRALHLADRDQELDADAEHEDEMEESEDQESDDSALQFLRTSSERADRADAAVASRGVESPNAAYPHREAIQASFGQAIPERASVGASEACGELGAEAFAMDGQVAFRDDQPSLHTAAHEAAHTIQQGSTVRLKGGDSHDAHEQQADAAADRVVRGERADDLLPQATERAQSAGPQLKDTKKKKKKKPKARQKADGTKPGEVVQLMYKAEDALTVLIGLSEQLELQAKAKDPEPSVAFAQEMVGKQAPAEEALDTAYKTLSRYIGDEASAAKQPYDVIKDKTLEHAGMGEVVQSVTMKLATYIANIDSASNDHAPIKGVFQAANTGRMVKYLGHVRANLNLPAHGWEALKGLVEIRVGVGVVDLGSGNPRDQIQESVIGTAQAWNSKVSNFSDAVEEFVGVIEGAEFEKADDGFIGKLWGVSKGLLEKGATFISGTPLAFKFGVAALSAIYDHEKKLELMRKQGDQDAFIAELKKQVKAMQMVANASDSNITKLVGALDTEFLKMGKGTEDEWKPGHQGVVGVQADFLKNLAKNSQEYAGEVPAQGDFTGRFLEQWVTSNHKQRDASAFRSPFADSKYWDGYIGCRVELKHSGFDWMLTESGSATMHCPKAADVLKAMKQHIDPFHVGNIDCPVHVEVVVDDDDKLPPFMKDDRSFTVQLDAGHSVSSYGSSKDKWNWITKNVEPTHHILARFGKVGS